MNKTTKIVLISLGSLVLLGGSYLIFRYYRKKSKKSEEDVLQSKLTEIKTTTTTQPTSNKTVENTNTTKTGLIKKQETIDKLPIKPVSLVSSSSTPTTIVTLSNPTAIDQPNLSSASYLRLDDKLKKFYRVLGMLGVNNGKLVYVADGDFVPSEPNRTPPIDVQKAVWRALYNDYLSVLSGFNRDETNPATKNYGNKMLDLFKVKRLDYLFPPVTATGQMSEFNPNAPWFLKVERENVKLKTDFWKD